MRVKYRDYKRRMAERSEHPGRADLRGLDHHEFVDVMGSRSHASTQTLCVSRGFRHRNE